MRVIVCGGRDYADQWRVDDVLGRLHADRTIDLIVHGGARGADALAEEWAAQANVPVDTYPADWTRHGRAAGPMRNRVMLKNARADLVVAFPGGSGTAHMVRIARAAGVPVIEVQP